MGHRGFFYTLNYSSCNEDWRTERRALRVGPQDRVLCITGSGDRPLHLLLDKPAAVTAVDLNPCQGFLLQLKMAAMKTLEYEEYVRFLGLKPHDTRVSILRDLNDQMSDEARAYWSDNLQQVEAGVIYQGRWERYYRVLSRVARFMRPRVIRLLFEMSDIDAQRAFVDRTWDRRWWRLVFDLMCSRIFSRVFLRDPAFYRHVAPGLRLGRYIYEGMLGSLQQHLARQNFMLSLVFLGRLAPEDLPPYLQPGAVALLRELLGRVEVRTQALDTLLEQAEPGTYSRFSLSDVPSYMEPSAFYRLLESMARAATPKARFCIRQFLTDHPWPEHLSSMLVREPELEEQLRQQDRAFAYRFFVGTVVKEDRR